MRDRDVVRTLYYVFVVLIGSTCVRLRLLPAQSGWCVCVCASELAGLRCMPLPPPFTSIPSPRFTVPPPLPLDATSSATTP